MTKCDMVGTIVVLYACIFFASITLTIVWLDTSTVNGTQQTAKVVE